MPKLCCLLPEMLAKVARPAVMTPLVKTLTKGIGKRMLRCAKAANSDNQAKGVG